MGKRDELSRAQTAGSHEPAQEASEDVDPSRTRFVGGPIPPVLTEFSESSKPTASDLAYGTNTSSTSHAASIETAYTSVTLAEHDASALTATLVPSYKRARDARDVEALAEIGGRLLGVVVRMTASNATAAQLLRKPMKHQSVPGASLDQDLGTFEHQQYAETHGAQLEQRVIAALGVAADALVPHQFRGQEVAGVVPVLNVEGPPELIRARLAGELDRTMQLLVDIAHIEKLVQSQKKHDQSVLDSARSIVDSWAHRPIDIAFLRAALGATWNVLDATAPAGAKPSDALDQATKQAHHTGWLGDTGQFDIHEAEMWLNLGGSENAWIVYRKLTTADPDTRARLLMQMKQRRLLDKFCSSFGWEPIKQLHDGLGYGFPEIKSDLQKYFIGGKDKWGPSLGEEWDSHKSSLHHLLGSVPHVGGALNFVADLATFGFNSSYGRARDAYTAGQTSEDDWETQRNHIYARTAAMAFVSIVTGGAADKFVRGGAATVSTVRAIGAGMAGGATGSVTGLATSDAYNVYVSGEQESFSSPENYVKAASWAVHLAG